MERSCEFCFNNKTSECNSCSEYMEKFVKDDLLNEKSHGC